MGWVYAGIEQDNFTREYSDFYLIKKMIKFILPFKVPFILTLVALVSQSIIILLAPLAFTESLNSFQQGNDLNLVIVWASVYLLFNVLVFVFYFLMMCQRQSA